MKITTTTFDRLSPEQLAAWEDWQRQDPALASPYFHPEFVRLAASIRANVEIALMEDRGGLAGILPFARLGDIGMPVAAPLNDFQGVIARPGFAWDAKQLVSGCGLAALRFDHLLTSQRSFARFHDHVAPSPYLDLSHGFEAYEEERLKAGCVELGQAGRKTRKIRNQVGPLRFAYQADDDEAFRLLVDWKSKHFQRTGTIDLFSFPWVVELLDKIRRFRATDFCGVLSVLYAGERIVAVHLGMHAATSCTPGFPPTTSSLPSTLPGPSSSWRWPGPLPARASIASTSEKAPRPSRSG